jgi:hypothetical protein
VGGREGNILWEDGEVENVGSESSEDCSGENVEPNG